MSARFDMNLMVAVIMIPVKKVATKAAKK